MQIFLHFRRMRHITNQHGTISLVTASFFAGYLTDKYILKRANAATAQVNLYVQFFALVLVFLSVEFLLIWMEIRRKMTMGSGELVMCFTLYFMYAMYELYLVFLDEYVRFV